MSSAKVAPQRRNQRDDLDNFLTPKRGRDRAMHERSRVHNEYGEGNASALAFRDGDRVDLVSKAGKPLTRYFPDVVEVMREVGARRFVLDGEIVVRANGTLSFDDLLLRCARPSASLAAFGMPRRGRSSGRWSPNGDSASNCPGNEKSLNTNATNSCSGLCRGRCKPQTAVAVLRFRPSHSPSKYSIVETTRTVFRIWFPSKMPGA